MDIQVSNMLELGARTVVKLGDCACTIYYNYDVIMYFNMLAGTLTMVSTVLGSQQSKRLTIRL